MLKFLHKRILQVGLALYVLAVVSPNFARAGTASALTLTPNTGAGTGPQIFTGTYTDTSGTWSFGTGYLSFGSASPVPNGCTVGYALSGGGFLLYADNGVGQVPVSGGSSISNSQCRVATGGAPSTSGNNVIVPFTVTFLPSFSGQKTIYAWASDAFSGESARLIPLGPGTRGERT